MGKDKDIATEHEVLEQLATLDLEKIYWALVHFAMDIMIGGNFSHGEEIVDRVFEKVVNGVRKWNKEYSFQSFLFGAVRSLVYQYNRRTKLGPYFPGQPDIENISDPADIDQQRLNELRELCMTTLKQHVPPPDEVEELIFECWLNEITKPRDIAEFLELDVNDIYNGTKRLKRKIRPIYTLLKSESYE